MVLYCHVKFNVLGCNEPFVYASGICFLICSEVMFTVFSFIIIMLIHHWYYFGNWHLWRLQQVQPQVFGCPYSIIHIMMLADGKLRSSDRSIHDIIHDDVIKWKHFPRYLPFVRWIYRWPVNSLHTGQWRGPLMFSLICAWINRWVNNRESGDLRRSRAHHDVIVMFCGLVDAKITWNIKSVYI